MWMRCPVGTKFDNTEIPRSCQSFIQPTWTPRSDFSPSSGGYLNYSSGIPNLPLGDVVVAVGVGNGRYLNQGVIYDFAIWEYPKY
jgi:hypothetical protein